MPQDPRALHTLLERADEERGAGRSAEAARLYDEAAALSEATGDLAARTRSVLGAASVLVFGSEPGKLPALLHDVLARTTDPATRSRLAAALARCWAYSGQSTRGAPFADEAVANARLASDPALLADALDAALAVHWGPDELDVRHALASELDDVAAHVVDPEARLQAHLWGLHVACERLDVQGMHRQIRALERLGEESERALFFAASRRLMLDLLRGRTDTTPQLLRVAQHAADESSLADAWMVLGAMEAYSLIQSGDADALVPLAELAESFAVAEGVAAVYAEAAVWWLGAQRPDRARLLLDTFHGTALDELPRDMNWLLTLQSILEVALALGDEHLTQKVVGLLKPYPGRAVVNAGAVMFHGVTDDTLARAHAVLGDDAESARLRAQALATYERIGAQWWRHRLITNLPERAVAPAAPVAEPTLATIHLYPTQGELWMIGHGPTPVAPLRGYGYLRELVRRRGQPIRALDLAASGLPTVEATGLGELADPRALAAYRRRLTELEEELAEAEAWADTGRLGAAQAEREALLDEVGRVTGLAGRLRTTGSSQERARVAVRKAISTALERIALFDEPLSRHLRGSVHTGLICTYDPEPDQQRTWVLEAPAHAAPGARQPN
jgi:hypothetical protein